MLRQKLFKKAFLILILVGVLNLITTKLYLHWSLWWVDIILHFFGGLCVTLFALWFGGRNSNLKDWSKSKILLTSIISAFLIGILWEAYELYVGLTFLSDGARYFADSGSDLIMDIVGGIFGFLYTNQLLKKYE